MQQQRNICMVLSIHMDMLIILLVQFPAYNEDGSYLFYNKTEGYETILNYNILNERDNTGSKDKESDN